MILVHVVAIVVFALVMLFTGGNMSHSVQEGAIWGYWISLVLGCFAGAIYIIVLLVGTLGGTVAGAENGGVVGAIAGTLGMFVALVIVIAIAGASVLLAVFGYHWLGASAAGNFADKALLIKSLVCLGLSILLGLLTSKSSSD